MQGTDQVGRTCVKASVVYIDAGGRRARRDFEQLVTDALVELQAARAGDLGGVYGAHRLLSQAVSLILEHGWDAA